MFPIPCSWKLLLACWQTKLYFNTESQRSNLNLAPPDRRFPFKEDMLKAQFKKTYCYFKQGLTPMSGPGEKASPRVKLRSRREQFLKSPAPRNTNV